MSLTTTAMLLLAAVQVADVLTTYRILRDGGRELNPVVRYVIERLGLKRAMAVKVVFVMGLAFMAHPWPMILWGMVVISAIPVFYNVRQLKEKS